MNPRHRLTVVVLVLALVTGSASLVVPVAAAAPVITAAATAAAAQCAVANGPNSHDAAEAAQIMAGRVTVGHYGTYALAANPNWKPQKTLDSSGNANLHGLTWALSLLREGVRTGNQAVVNRFAALLGDWGRDVRPQPLSASGPYSAMPEGQRLLTLTCALASPLAGQRWLFDLARAQAQWIARPDQWRLVNNVNLQQAMGLYAVATALGRRDLQATATARLGQIAGRLLLADGSDREGSTSYALGNYTWFGQAARRWALGGTALPATVAGYTRIPQLLAAATRPDGLLEAIGDAVPTATPSVPGTAAEWAGSLGSRGVAPTRLLSSFAGGFVFDRSGWGTAATFRDQTFLSLRTGGAGATAPHAHADIGALTLASRGSQLLFDSGQYRYAANAGRRYVVSRAAHNNVEVLGAVPRTVAASVRVLRSVATGDLITLTDAGYPGLTITRTVYYDRPGDYLLVWDTVTRARGALPRGVTSAAQHWNLGRDRTVRLDVGAPVARTHGPGANLVLAFVGAAPKLSVAKGRRAPSYLGFNSAAYGELVPAPTLSATRPLSGATWVTVLVPTAPGQDPATVRVTGTVRATGATVRVRAPGVSHQVTLSRTAVSRIAIG